jgi:predicted type IV restriction endonuclease
MASRELTKLVKDLSQIIINAPDRLQQSERNEEWTKVVLILPLLEGLGWDRATDVSYESSPDEIEGFLDYILKCQPPIGVEAKALDVKFPLDRTHSQVKKGLKQSKDRGASYFIWTNGDCWQFYSLALANAPVYKIILSSAGGREEQVEYIANKLRIIEKEHFTENPKIFDEDIRKNWKMAALPAAWNLLFEKHTDDLIQLVRKGLPAELDIKSDEILRFLKTLKTSEDVSEHRRSRTRQPKKKPSFPDDWEQLLNSFEPDYERARERFRRGYNHKLGQWVISENYKPWSKSITWRHVGAPNEPNERKQLGPVVAFFREWGFIEEEEGTDKYVRVEECVPYLKKLLEKMASP